jgi:F-type H+-transporting ATPase subunit b
MQFDPVTVIAQLVNFALLIWVLQKLLYSPVLKLIAQREADIAAHAESAEAETRAARSEAERFETERQALEASRAQTIEHAKQTGKAQAKTIIERAREKARQTQLAHEQDLELQSTQLKRQLTLDATHKIETIAARCLRDLADEELQHAMAKRLATAVRDLPTNTKNKIRQYLQDKPARLIAPINIEAPTKKLLKSALQSICDNTVEIEVQTVETLSPGLVLELGPQTLEWTVEAYLSEFTQHLRDTLETGSALQSAQTNKTSAR